MTDVLAALKSVSEALDIREQRLEKLSTHVEDVVASNQGLAEPNGATKAQVKELRIMAEARTKSIDQMLTRVSGQEDERC